MNFRLVILASVLVAAALAPSLANAQSRPNETSLDAPPPLAPPRADRSYHPRSVGLTIGGGAMFIVPYALSVTLGTAFLTSGDPRDALPGGLLLIPCFGPIAADIALLNSNALAGGSMLPIFLAASALQIGGTIVGIIGLLPAERPRFVTASARGIWTIAPGAPGAPVGLSVVGSNF